MSSLATAWGILDADPVDQLLLAVRDVNQQELVTYRWRWRRDLQH